MTDLDFQLPPKPPPRGFQISLLALLVLTALVAMMVAPFTFFHQTKFRFGDEERMAWRLSPNNAQSEVRNWFAERSGRHLDEPPLWWTPEPHPQASRVRVSYFSGRLENGDPYYVEVAFLDTGDGPESSAVSATFAVRSRAITWDRYDTMHRRQTLINVRDSFADWFHDRSVEAYDDYVASNGTTILGAVNSADSADDSVEP